jgi:hypothetical protein
MSTVESLSVRVKGFTVRLEHEEPAAEHVAVRGVRAGVRAWHLTVGPVRNFV